MTMKLKAVFEGATERKLDDGRKIFKGVATSLALDRYQEVVLPRGMDAGNFTENPVLLYGHDMKAAPIGQVLALDEGDNNVKFEFVFDDSDDDAQKIQKKYENGTMRTFSIGFLPKRWKFVDELRDKKGNLPDTVELEVGEEGAKFEWDTSQYKEAPSLVFTSWELLEISAVSVPANPEAQLLALARNMIGDYRLEHPESAIFAERAINEKVVQLSAILREFADTPIEVTGVVPVDTPESIDFGDDWDVSAAQARIAKWASADGSGLKAEIDWAKYSSAFAWFDPQETEAYSSYKLLHHTVDEEGHLCLSETGVYKAMAVLLTSQDSDFYEVHGKAIYDHLATHYRQMEKPCPEWDGDYSSGDIRKIEDGVFAAVTEEETPEVKTTKEELTVLALRDTIEAIGAELRTFALGLDERLVELSIKTETQTETIAALVREMTRTVSSDADDDGDDGDSPGGVEEEKSLEKLKGVLSRFYQPTDSE